MERFKPHSVDGDLKRDKRILEREPGETTAEDTATQREVREMIDSIDESVVRDIFSEHIQKAGGKMEDSNFVPFENIHVLMNATDDSDAASTFGGYQTDQGVRVYAEQINDRAKLLWTIIHEELHAVTDTGLLKLQNKPDVPGEEYAQQIGFEAQYFFTTEDGIEAAYEWQHTNEGFTEYLAGIIFDEYLKRTGETEEIGAEHIAKERTENWEDVYGLHRKNVKVYMAVLAAIADVPRELVESGMIRGYLRNGLVIPAEVFEELERREEGATFDFQRALSEGNIEEVANSLAEDFGFFSPEEKAALDKNFAEILERINQDYETYKKLKEYKSQPPSH